MLLHGIVRLLIFLCFVLADEQPSRSHSAHARAQLVLNTNQISFDPKLHLFTVKGTSGVPRVVTLYPKETCSCPSTGNCYHLLAVKMSVGVPQHSKPSRRNLTQLRKNTRSRKEKKGGRKRPRPNDTESGIQGMLSYFLSYITSCPTPDKQPLSPPPDDEQPPSQKQPYEQPLSPLNPLPDDEQNLSLPPDIIDDEQPFSPIPNEQPLSPLPTPDMTRDEQPLFPLPDEQLLSPLPDEQPLSPLPDMTGDEQPLSTLPTIPDETGDEQPQTLNQGTAPNQE